MPDEEDDYNESKGDPDFVYDYDSIYGTGERRRPFSPSKGLDKWGADILKSGYTLLPNHVININLYLKPRSRLTGAELMLLIIVLSNWWDPDQLPAASKGYLGSRLGISSRQVQRLLKSMVTKGVFRRKAGSRKTGGATKFDITPVVDLIRQVTGLKARNTKQFALDFERVMDPELVFMKDMDIDDIPF